MTRTKPAPAASRSRTAKHRVMIVDDHPILRRGVARLLDDQSDMAACAEAEDAKTALRLIDEDLPDLVIADISLRDTSSGMDLIKALRVRHPELPVLVLTMHTESFYAECAFRAGARGFVTKGESGEHLLAGIRRVLAGEVYVSERIAARMVDKLVGARRDDDVASIDRLSDREFQIFELIGQGLQTREIARRLHLSVKTVDAHRENIKGKLRLRDAVELMKTAIQWVQFESGA